LRHLEMYGIDDAGDIMFGRIGREIFSVAFFLCRKTFISYDWVKVSC
jgi:hypothetical protein